MFKDVKQLKIIIILIIVRKVEMRLIDLACTQLHFGCIISCVARSSMIASSGDVNLMSKSIASFHLTGKKTMNTSVDRLFDTDNVFTGTKRSGF